MSILPTVSLNLFKPLIEHYNEKFPEIILIYYGGIVVLLSLLYMNLCEKESVYYVIRLKSNAQFTTDLADELPSCLYAPSDVTKTECYFEETDLSSEIMV